MSQFSGVPDLRGRLVGSLRQLLPALASGWLAVANPLAAQAAPEAQLTVSEWAQAHRVVGQESGSPHPGPWSNARSPYLVEPMDACQVDNGIARVVITGSAQFGKSEIPLNALGHMICTSPRLAMVVLPSIDEARTWSRLKWEPNVAESPAWRSRVNLRVSRSDSGSTQAVKKYAGGSLELVTAGASKPLQMKTIGLIIFEEVAQYEEAVGVGGDPIDAAEGRQWAVGDDRKSILCSTPGFKGRCRITQEYNASDMRRWMTLCPICKTTYFLLKYSTFQQFEGRPCFVAPCCGGVIEEEHKHWMNDHGRWVPTFAHPENDPEARERNPAPPELIPAEEIERWASRDCEGRARGYHLWQAQSNLSSWTVIWEKKTKLENGTGDPIEFAQKLLGEPYEEIVERPDHEKLLSAAGVLYSSETIGVPEWASMVTASIDVQVNRLEWAAYAWGRGGVGARIAKGVIARNPLDWDTWRSDAQALVDMQFKGASYKPRVADYWGIDSGGNATDNVYKFGRINQSRSQGPVVVLKGDSHDKGDAPIMRVGNKVKVTWRGRPDGKIQLYFVGTHGAKDRVYYGLNQGVLSADLRELQPRALLYPKEATQEDFRQLTAEHIQRDDPTKRGKWVKPQGQANEQLDLVVYALALAVMEGLDRLSDEQWAERATARAPDLIEQQLTPIERAIRDAQADDGETPAAPPAPKPLTPPPAEGKAPAVSSEEAAERLREMGRQAWRRD